jgi:hypothetical protein
LDHQPRRNQFRPVLSLGHAEAERITQPVSGPVNRLLLFPGSGIAIAIRKRRISTIDRHWYVNMKNPFTFMTRLRHGSAALS